MRNGFAFPRDRLEKDVIPKNKADLHNINTEKNTTKSKKKTKQIEKVSQTNGFDKADTR